MAIMMVAISGPGEQIYPQFRNDRGAAHIRIGTREFECVGQSPPDDHPHIFLDMGEKDHILCPYCGALFEFDAKLDGLAAEPADGVFQAG